MSPSEAGRNVVPRRQAGSPEPYIKPEPASPGPMSQVPNRDYADPPETRSPVFYRQVPTGDNRVAYEEVRPARAPAEQPLIRRIASPRVVSGPGGGYEVRREPDLRRIVSARKPLRAISPQPEYFHAPPPLAHAEVARARAITPPRNPYEPIVRRPASRAYVALPEQEPSLAYTASTQPHLAPAYPISGHEGSPPSPSGPYVPSRRDGPLMGPPPRTIVVDKYGNEFYETTDYAPMPRGSAAPEARWARGMPPPVHARASVRPEPSYVERYGQRLSPEAPSPTYVEYREMQPPPRVLSRAGSRAPLVYERTQTGEYGPVADAGREYDPRYNEPLPPPPPGRTGAVRSASVAPLPLPSQRPVYVDDRAEPAYERSYRVPTAQPDVVRYSDVPPRAGTVMRQIPTERERMEYREAPRPVYQYVDEPRDPYRRGYGGGGMVFVDEHGRRVQRM